MAAERGDGSGRGRRQFFPPRSPAGPVFPSGSSPGFSSRLHLVNVDEARSPAAHESDLSWLQAELLRVRSVSSYRRPGTLNTCWSVFFPNDYRRSWPWTVVRCSTRRGNSYPETRPAGPASAACRCWMADCAAACATSEVPLTAR